MSVGGGEGGGREVCERIGHCGVGGGELLLG